MPPIMLFMLSSPNMSWFAIPGYRREVHENCVLLGHYVASRVNSLQTFRDILSLPSSGVKNPFKLGPIGCPETSRRDYRSSLRNNPEEGMSHVSIRSVTSSGRLYT